MENRINENNENRKDVKKTLRGIYVGESAKEVTIEASLDAYYKLLNCDIIDITTRQIGGRDYAIICDDEDFSRNRPRLVLFIRVIPLLLSEKYSLLIVALKS